MTWDVWNLMNIWIDYSYLITWCKIFMGISGAPPPKCHPPQKNKMNHQRPLIIPVNNGLISHWVLPSLQVRRPCWKVIININCPLIIPQYGHIRDIIRPYCLKGVVALGRSPWILIILAVPLHGCKSRSCCRPHNWEEMLLGSTGGKFSTWAWVVVFTTICGRTSPMCVYICLHLETTH